MSAQTICIGIAAVAATTAVWLWTASPYAIRRLDGPALRTGTLQSNDTAGQARVCMPDGKPWHPPTAMVLELLWVAIERGAPLPRAFIVVGSVVGGPIGVGLCRAAHGLLSGLSWQDAWAVPCALPNWLLTNEPESGGHRPRDSNRHRTVRHTRDPHVAAARETLRLARDTLEPSWTHGVRAGPRLRAVIEQLDSTERMRVERRSQQLSVRLLVPTGLCFLPAFLCIAVIPTIASFAMTI